jgi:hypothetical protein
LAPSALGKLNGVLHASPNAIAHANINSPIGTAKAFGEALAGLLGGEDTTNEEEATEEDSEPVTVDQLGEMMANMTNKPVTAAQVEAVAAKVGIETEEDADEATGDETATDDTAADEPSDEDQAPKLDEATAEAIANKANEIHGFTEGTDAGETGGTDDDETVTD